MLNFKINEIYNKIPIFKIGEILEEPNFSPFSSHPHSLHFHFVSSPINQKRQKENTSSNFESNTDGRRNLVLGFQPNGGKRARRPARASQIQPTLFLLRSRSRDPIRSRYGDSRRNPYLRQEKRDQRVFEAFR